MPPTPRGPRLSRRHFLAAAPTVAAIEAGAAPALRQSSHRLAGGALNLGVTYAGEAVRRLEAISDVGTTDGAAERLDEVAGALERGRQALAAYRVALEADPSNLEAQSAVATAGRTTLDR